MERTLPIIADSLFADWLQRARAGSDEALGRLFGACKGYLLRCAQRQIGRDLQSKVEADDLVQETFLEAQRAFEEFRGDTRVALESWLVSILLHNAHNLRRHYRETSKRRVACEMSLDRP